VLLRSLVLTAIASGALVCSADAARTAAPPDACALVTIDEAISVIGSSDADLAGPDAVRPGTCSWHSTQSGCTLRVFSVELTRGSVAQRLASVRDEADTWSGAPGVGDDAFYTADALPAGAAVFIEHLHLRRGDTMAVLTLLGRIGADASHDLLARVGTAVASRL
jgi:hypothetical protein